MQILILHGNSQIDINVPKQSCNSEITETDSKNQPFWHAYKLIYFSAYLQLHVCTSYVGRKFLLTRIQFCFSFNEYQNADNCKNIR